MRQIALALLAISFTVGCVVAQQAAEPKFTKDGKPIEYIDTDTGRWRIHDMNRPRPPIVEPATPSTQDTPGKAPGDAIVLFDGTDLDEWCDGSGNDTKWILGEGYMESVKKAGYIKTRRKFGSCQLHVEFATPTPPKGTSQGRGNSGVFLMDTYELQVLDSKDNVTYADGQCGALYGRHVPEVNVCRKPGEWQTYDIIFYRPTFKDGKVDRKAEFIILHNGSLIQKTELAGGTGWNGPHAISKYRPHADELPIALQDHGNPVRYRNVWIRELKD